MEPLNKTDTLIRNYVMDCPKFIEVWEWETEDGDTYEIYIDQDGEEELHLSRRLLNKK